MSIRPHPTKEGCFYLDYYPNGRKGKRERIPFGSYQEALNYQRKHSNPTKEAVTHPAINEVAPAYLEWVKDNQSDDTYTNRERRFRKHILPALGHYRVKQLSQRILDEYAAPLPRSTYFTDICALLALIRWMVKRKYCEPLGWKPEVPTITRKVKVLPDPADMARFIEAIPVEMHRVIALMILYTGLRLKETRYLRWEGYQGDSVLMEHSKTHDPMVIPIPEPLRSWFQANQKPEGYVFSHHGDKPICNITKSMEKAEALTGIYVRAHLLRHASATYLYELTEDIYAVQKHLRHSKPATSQIYTRYSAARRKTSVQSLVDYMRQTQNEDSSGLEP